MKTLKYITFLIISLIMIPSCNDDFLDRFPETEIGKENFFNSKEDLNMYIYNLYNFQGVGGYYADGYNTTDNAANTGNTEVKSMMTGVSSASTITSGWEWETLHTINFFLENFDKASITDEEKNHFEGLARFFRAQFYMDKVKRYSNVPWYDKTLSTNDTEELYKPSDNRDFVVQKIFEDYAFAAENVMGNQPAGAVDTWVVKAFQSRNALYEGTYRKYHSELNLASSANQYIQLAMEVAKDIMDNGGFTIYSTGEVANDYGSLFINDDLTGNPEVILVNISESNVRNSGWSETVFGNYETCPSRDLLQAYLMNDGTFYSSQPGYQTKLFVEEFQNRDPRLSQTYAYPGFVLINTNTYSQGGGIYIQQLAKNFSGYHQIKGFVNETSQDAMNGVDYPVIRYAEILLNYAEARAELGELTQSDLDNTVNIIRERVEMPHLTMNPAVDPMQESSFPNVTVNTQWKEILEIRRERRIELAMEGFRFDDLMRWKAGTILEKEPEGIYFPSLGKYDMTGDGVEDIILIDVSASIPAAEDKEVNSLGEKLIYYRAGLLDSDASVYLKNGNNGTIQTIGESGTFVEPKYYYRPIPETQTAINKNLVQIMGW